MTASPGRGQSPASPAPHGGLRVLRLCSVFDSDHLGRADARFDPVGGMQFHTAQLTRALDRRGVVQDVVTAWRPNGPRHEEVGQGATVHRIGAPTQHFRQLYGPLAAAATDRLGRRADLVHAHLGEDLAVLALAALASRHGAPLVVTVHCSLRHTLASLSARTKVLRLLGGPMETRAEHRAAAVITLAAGTALRLLAGGVPEERLRVIPSGFAPSLFAGPFPDPSPAVRGPRVLFVGRLVDQKGVDSLLRAMESVRCDAHLVIVGDGPRRRDLERLVRRQALHRRVTFTGFVPHHAVPAHLHHADVVVLPSVYEELGSVLIEAMAAGTPTVATAVGGIPDAVTHGSTGLLVPPGDDHALARAVNRVLGDHSLSARLREGARRRAAEFSWDRLAALIHDVYREVVPSEHRSAAKSPPASAR